MSAPDRKLHKLAGKTQRNKRFKTMNNPAHPGRVLREYLGDLTVAEAALRLGVARTALSRILNGSADISADMALRLRDALGTGAEMWINMQAQYDLWQAKKKASSSYRVVS